MTLERLFHKHIYAFVCFAVC